jgi:hypothetical protein
MELYLRWSNHSFALALNKPAVISSQATDTIDYVATDGTGLTATSTRVVLIEAAASAAAANAASSTAATSTSQ